MTVAQLIDDCHLALGEGLSLFPDGSLHCVDLLAGRVFRINGSGSTLVQEFPYEVSKVLPWTGGHLALTRRGVEMFSHQGERHAIIDITDGNESLRCSDAAVLPGGQIAVGVMDRDMTQDRGRLVVVHPTGDIDTVVEAATIPNGIDVFASGESAVWVDSPTRTLMTFEIDSETGSLVSPTPWMTLPAELGVPDGLCCDSDGGLWVAMWGGGTVIHLDATGRIDQEISVPVEHVTSVAFAADNTLIITTGHIVYTEQDQPLPPGAGGLYAVAAKDHGTTGQLPRVASLRPRQTRSENFHLTVSRKSDTSTSAATTVNVPGVRETTAWKEHP